MRNSEQKTGIEKPWKGRGFSTKGRISPQNGRRRAKKGRCPDILPVAICYYLQRGEVGVQRKKSCHGSWKE